MPESSASTTGEQGATWIDVAATADLQRQRSRVVDGPDADIVVFWNDGTPVAMANICVHRDRELQRANIFAGRVICPGHQWGFDVETGFCRERERSQPLYAVQIVDGVVQVDVSRPANLEHLTPLDLPRRPNRDA